MKRPTSISVISVLMIVMGSLGVFGSINMARMMDDPQFGEVVKASSSLPTPVLVAMSLMGVLVLIASGVAMFKGHNWGRWLYVGWTLFSLLLSAVTAPNHLLLMVPSLLFFAVIVFFLFRPAANAYFNAAEPADASSL